MPTDERVIHDESMEEIAEFLKNMCMELDKAIIQYINILTALCSNSLISGETAAALAAFKDCASNMKGCYESLGYGIEQELKVFVSNSQEADSPLYS